MSKFIYTNAYFAINGTTLHDHVSAVTVEDTANEVDLTTFGNNGYTEVGQGLKDATVTVTFFQDFAASSVHSILQPLYASGGTFGVEVRPTQAAASPTNQKVTFTGRLYSYGGIAGKVGDAATFDVAIRNAGSGVTWGTS